MPDTETRNPTQPKDPSTKTSETSAGAHQGTEEQAVEPGTLEVPWTDRDVRLLAVALQTTGPFVLGNDVRSAESAEGVAVQLLELFQVMDFEQPKPKAEFHEERVELYADQLRENRAGNARRPTSLPEHTPTPTEQVANRRRRDDETDDKGTSDKEVEEVGKVQDKFAEERDKEAGERRQSRQLTPQERREQDEKETNEKLAKEREDRSSTTRGRDK
jgi:hypothetical protein